MPPGVLLLPGQQHVQQRFRMCRKTSNTMYELPTMETPAANLGMSASATCCECVGIPLNGAILRGEGRGFILSSPLASVADLPLPDVDIDITMLAWSAEIRSTRLNLLDNCRTSNYINHVPVKSRSRNPRPVALQMYFHHTCMFLRLLFVDDSAGHFTYSMHAKRIVASRPHPLCML